jgi:hypothetical protein
MLKVANRNNKTNFLSILSDIQQRCTLATTTALNLVNKKLLGSMYTAENEKGSPKMEFFYTEKQDAFLKPRNGGIYLNVSSTIKKLIFFLST